MWKVRDDQPVADVHADSLPPLCKANQTGVPTYRLHDTTGDDVGLVEHPAPNVEPGDVVMLQDGREALVVARVETGGVGPFARCSK